MRIQYWIIKISKRTKIHFAFEIESGEQASDTKQIHNLNCKSGRMNNGNIISLAQSKAAEVIKESTFRKHKACVRVVEHWKIDQHQSVCKAASIRSVGRFNRYVCVCVLLPGRRTSMEMNILWSQFASIIHWIICSTCTVRMSITISIYSSSAPFHKAMYTTLLPIWKNPKEQ